MLFFQLVSVGVIVFAIKRHFKVDLILMLDMLFAFFILFAPYLAKESIVTKGQKTFVIGFYIIMILFGTLYLWTLAFYDAASESQDIYEILLPSPIVPKEEWEKEQKVIVDKLYLRRYYVVIVLQIIFLIWLNLIPIRCYLTESPTFLSNYLASLQKYLLNISFLPIAICVSIIFALVDDNVKMGYNKILFALGLIFASVVLDNNNFLNP